MTPRFEFGFGLSYTTFGYSGLSISSSGDMYYVSFSIKNLGSLAGTEIPQLYLGYPASAGEPKKVLRNFEEVPLGVGESRTVTMLLDRRSMRYAFVYPPFFLSLLNHIWLQCLGYAKSGLCTTSWDIHGLHRCIDSGH